MFKLNTGYPAFLGVFISQVSGFHSLLKITMFFLSSNTHTHTHTHTHTLSLSLSLFNVLNLLMKHRLMSFLIVGVCVDTQTEL